MVGKNKTNESEILKKLHDLLPVLHKAAIGDFSKRVKITEKEDELTEFLIALNLLLDDLQEMEKERDEQKEKLEKTVQERTKELELQTRIIDNMAEGAYIVGLKDGKIKYANPKFEKMFGYGSGELLGKNVSVVNAPTEEDPTKTANDIMKAIKKTGEWHGEVKNIKKNGKEFWSYANVSVFDHPTYGRVSLSIHSDITTRKLAEEKLKEKLEELQKMNRLMVGRELVMADMKEKIKKLEKLCSKT